MDDICVILIMKNNLLKLYDGDDMRKLEISFTDTNEKAMIDENSLVIALDNKTTLNDITKCFILEVDESLPDILANRPLMFYIYDDLPILKLYRSAYISSYQWLIKD